MDSKNNVKKNSKNNNKFNKNNKQKTKSKKDINDIEKDVIDAINNKNSYSFLINALNQANLTNTYNVSPIQANAFFVLVHPYHIENFYLDGLNLDIKINDDGSVIINNEVFQALEIGPGVKVFGISKRE